MTIIQELFGYKQVSEDGVATKKLVPNALVANGVYLVAGAIAEDKVEGIRDAVANAFGLATR